MGSGRNNLSRLQGTAWHKEFLRKKEDDPRRHKHRCVYHRNDGTCRYMLDRCPGSSHCTHYKDAILEKEKKAYKEKKISWQALSTSVSIPNMAQICDTLELADIYTGKLYQIVLSKGCEHTSTLHSNCLGKYLRDCVSFSSYKKQTELSTAFLHLLDQTLLKKPVQKKSQQSNTTL